MTEEQQIVPNRKPRFPQGQAFHDRLAGFAANARERAAKLGLGLKQDDLLRKARQADTASHIEGWITSPGLQPPK